MQDPETYIKWCIKQRRGIKITPPSENLVKAYTEKTRNAIKSMDLNAREGITDWAVSASYYAKYFATYALLQKIGIKSEIHDCTITLFEYLFKDTIPQETINQLRNSKQDRIDTQYYTKQTNTDLNQLTQITKNHVNQIQKTQDQLNKQRTQQLQTKLKNLTQ